MKKIIRLLLIVSMIFTQIQMTFAFTDPDSSNILDDSNITDVEQDQENAAIELEQDEVDGVVSDSNEANESNRIDDDEMQLAYLKIQEKELVVGQLQNIEIAVGNVDFIATNAQLTIKNISDGTITKVDAIKAVENFFTFEIEHEIQSDTTFQIVSITMDNGELTRELLLNTDDLSFTYTVVLSSNVSDSVLDDEMEDHAVISRGNNLDPNTGLVSDIINDTMPLINNAARNMERSNGVTIVLDPGHGGNDPGAVANGLIEKELTWKISNYTMQYLKQYNVNVHLTRTENENPSLETRAIRAANFGANILVSQHVNAGGGRGVEVFVSQNPNFQNSSTALGTMIVNNLAALGLNNRGVKTRLLNGGTVYNVNSNPDYYGIIRHSVSRGFPGIIIEHGFIDNAEDAAFLRVEANLKAMGEADAKALIAHYGLRRKVTLTGEGYPTPSNLTATGFNIKYGTHVSTIGWQPWREQGQTSGTSGQSLRIEGMRVGLVNTPNNNISLSARVHVDGYGWANYENVTEHTLLGTTGQSAGITGISFEMHGTSDYSLMYRAHVESIGWTDWTDRNTLGNVNNGRRIEAIEMKIEPNDSGLKMRGHIETIGWQNESGNGLIGTQDRGLRVESFRMSLHNPEYTGGIKYRSHVETVGWQGWVEDNAVSGTEGKSLRVEAIQVELTGEMKNHYDVYYRTHVAFAGWLDWASNGDSAGTEGFSNRIEAIEVRLVKKGDSAPTNTSVPFIKNGVISYTPHVESIGWMTPSTNGRVAGTTNRSLRVEALKVGLSNWDLAGSIEYRGHVESIGWQNWSKENEIAGTIGQSKRIEALQMKLTGTLSQHCVIYYRVHVEGFGWLDWASNGQSAGTAGRSRRIEAVQIEVRLKGQPAPGSTQRPFVN